MKLSKIEDRIRLSLELLCSKPEQDGPSDGERAKFQDTLVAAIDEAIREAIEQHESTTHTK